MEHIKYTSCITESNLYHQTKPIITIVIYKQVNGSTDPLTRITSFKFESWRQIIKNQSILIRHKQCRNESVEIYIICTNRKQS